VDRLNKTWKVGYLIIPARLFKFDGPERPSLYSTRSPSAFAKIQESTMSRAILLNFGSRKKHARHQDAYLKMLVIRHVSVQKLIEIAIFFEKK
jgi:hypothetical protein